MFVAEMDSANLDIKSSLKFIFSPQVAIFVQYLTFFSFFQIQIIQIKFIFERDFINKIVSYLISPTVSCSI